MNGLAWWLATADTLAAAFAEADRWEDAIARQERALRDLPADRTKYAEEFRQRLELYRQHHKWREHP